MQRVKSYVSFLNTAIQQKLSVHLEDSTYSTYCSTSLKILLLNNEINYSGYDDQTNMFSYSFISNSDFIFFQLTDILCIQIYMMVEYFIKIITSLENTRSDQVSIPLPEIIEFCRDRWLTERRPWEILLGLGDVTLVCDRRDDRDDRVRCDLSSSWWSWPDDAWKTVGEAWLLLLPPAVSSILVIVRGRPTKSLYWTLFLPTRFNRPSLENIQSVSLRDNECYEDLWNRSSELVQ